MRDTGRRWTEAPRTRDAAVGGAKLRAQRRGGSLPPGMWGAPERRGPVERRGRRFTQRNLRSLRQEGRASSGSHQVQGAQVSAAGGHRGPGPRAPAPPSTCWPLSGHQFPWGGWATERWKPLSLSICISDSPACQTEVGMGRGKEWEPGEGWER